MKKKLLIVSHALELGGAERSLIGLLNAFDFEKYEFVKYIQRTDSDLYWYFITYGYLADD